MEILMHIQEGAKPEQQRRISEVTGRPVAGYDPTKGKAHSFFYGAAKRKSQDIVKARCRRFRREEKIRSHYMDFGPFVTDGREDLEATDMHENREDWD